MRYEDILKALAPCGLDCGRCAGFKEGEIARLASRLSQLLAGYSRLANMRAGREPEFSGYSQFEEILTSFAKASCGGCRSDEATCPVTCKAHMCHKQKGVDFCFQCPDYPCEDPTLAPLKDRWKERNDRMKEIGIPEFYEELIKLPRY
jgi:Protein of unknown function (DUF3795)